MLTSQCRRTSTAMRRDAPRGGRSEHHGSRERDDGSITGDNAASQQTEQWITKWDLMLDDASSISVFIKI